MKTNRNAKIEHDFFANLPTEIMFDIFLRLTVQSIMSCKCVCKSWRDLIKTRYFVESHFSRSGSFLCIALQTTCFSETYKIIEFVNTQSSGQNCYSKAMLNFSFPLKASIYSSANGLLFLLNDNARDFFICNPITHEYLKLPSPVDLSIIHQFGFGVSKLSGDYKVVRLFYEDNRRTGPRKCEVYSLRRGLWRSIETAGDQLRCCQHMSDPIFLNGNLHWLVCSRNQYGRRILCFDLETECFSTFSIPRYHHHYGMICVLGGCLCLYESSHDGSFVLWLMKNYGDDKSWTKEFDIKKHGLRFCVPIKVYMDGVVLFFRRQLSSVLYYYSSKTKTIREIDVVESSRVSCIYTPNFLSLKTLTIENNVVSF